MPCAILVMTVLLALISPARAEDIPTEPRSMGVIGCSNTRQAVEGYERLSEIGLLADTAQGSKTVADWAADPEVWADYDQRRPDEGWAGVWLNLCERVETGLTEDSVNLVLDGIWLRDPGITVWMSPLNFYENELCEATGGNEIPNMGRQLADGLAATNDLVERGPDLGPVPSDMVRDDFCHLFPSGARFVGQQLVDFFDLHLTTESTSTTSSTSLPPTTTSTSTTTSTTVATTTSTSVETVVTSSPVEASPDSEVPENGSLYNVVLIVVLAILVGAALTWLVVTRRFTPEESSPTRDERD